MLIHPDIDPIAIHIGPLAVRWYGLMYLLAFILVIVIGRIRLRQPHVKALGWTAKDLDDLLFYGVLGTILGGRLGYVLFYKADYYFAHPLEVLRVWEGGMSFHGGMLGVIIAMIVFSWQRHRSWLQVTDFIAPLVPSGLAAGRLGNFINGELWGRVTDPTAPWAMLFPSAAPDDAQWMATHGPEALARGLIPFYERYRLLPRHPSELYEIALEGVALFIVMWLVSRKPRALGVVSAVFLIGYGLARFTVEFAREPDDFLGLLALGLSMGQWLSIPMILIGIGILVWALKRKRVPLRAGT